MAQKQLQREREAKQWIEQVLNIQLEPDLAFALRDSKILCHLLNLIKPGRIPEFQYEMESISELNILQNLGQFLAECRELGVPETALFLTNDLVEENKMDKVVDCILALKAIVNSRRRTSPSRQSNSSATSTPTTKHRTPKTNTSTSTKNALTPTKQRQMPAKQHIATNNLDMQLLTQSNGQFSQFCLNYMLKPLIAGIALGFGVKFARAMHINLFRVN